MIFHILVTFVAEDGNVDGQKDKQMEGWMDRQMGNAKPISVHFPLGIIIVIAIKI